MEEGGCEIGGLGAGGPVSGRSASFRLRFRSVRVVRAVRAGEAKPRGHMTNFVLIARPPPGESIQVFARGFPLRFLCYLHGFEFF